MGREVGGEVGREVGREVGGEVGGEMGREVGGEVGREVVGGEVGREVGGEVGGEMGREVGGEVGREVGREVGGEVGGEMGREVGRDSSYINAISFASNLKVAHNFHSPYSSILLPFLLLCPPSPPHLHISPIRGRTLKLISLSPPAGSECHCLTHPEALRCHPLDWRGLWTGSCHRHPHSG